MSAIRTIKLYGRLAEVSGHKELRLAVKSPADVFRALWALFPETRAVTINGNWRVWKTKGKDKEPVAPKTMKFPLGDADTIHIIPDGSQAGIGSAFLLGGLLIGGLAIAAALFLPIPNGVNSEDLENDDNLTSGVIDRPVQRVAEGHPAAVILSLIHISEPTRPY